MRLSAELKSFETRIGHRFANPELLVQALTHGSIATATILVRNGADCFARDFYGRTPHHYAKLYLHEAILDVLPEMSAQELERMAQRARELEEKRLFGQKMLPVREDHAAWHELLYTQHLG